MPFGERNRWDSALLEIERYHALFRRLKSRSADNRHLLQSFALHEELNLRWVLSHERQVLNEIRRYLKRSTGNAVLSPQKHNLVFLGKERDLYIADWPERILISVMAQVLTEFIDSSVSERVYSFRKGRGHWDAARSLADFLRTDTQRSVYVLKRDISKYGDTIDPKIALEILRTVAEFRESRLFAPLVERALKIQYESVVDGEPISACLIRGTPSGSPLTPPLENLYLGEMDRTLERYADCFYARFGDDFLFATFDEGIALEADERIEAITSKLGLTIKPQKKVNYKLMKNPVSGESPVFPPANRLEWLGLSLNRTGVIGCKHEHQQRAKHYLLGQVTGLIDRLGAFATAHRSECLAILRNGLNELLSSGSSTPVQSLLYQQENSAVLKQIDRHLAHVITRRLAFSWKIKKSEAWRYYRKLKTPSLLFQRNALYGKSRSKLERTGTE